MNKFANIRCRSVSFAKTMLELVKHERAKTAANRADAASYLW